MIRIRHLGLIAVLALVFWIGACSKPPAPVPQPGPPTPPASVSRILNLYFADDQAMYLAAEPRTVSVQQEDGKQLAAAAVNELIAGPKQSGLYPTIPPESKLLSVEVSNGLATLNFSQELQTKHSGGSTGERMTIYSLVNSLTEIPGIQKVQLLIEGKKLDSLKGHMDISGPLTRDQEILKK